ncbi:response regulator [Paenibacillus sp. PAMC21692]|uniref:response regulator transcription factor n=1 Tax=Paenibacillus sp. PAMC21692 TaxID=2762320 RepID=UPI00164E9E96|nr:response regulator [Paenibacillus sp. PAMC21692]QNK56380.1 response regulator [Paenibacillus sp. PAMC21692]
MYNVFIMDDEPWSREVVKSLGEWEKLGLRVAGEAEDGTEGLRQIGDQLPDIVVTDMRMPGIDGAELLQALYVRHPGTKLIVMSGYDDFIYTKGAIRSRAMEYLLKPISPEDLNAALARCKEELDREAGTRSSIFVSGEDVQRYAGHRARIYASLLSLDKGRVAGAFETLARDLASAKTSVAEAGGSSRIASDLLFMLEQFLSEQEVTLEQLLLDRGVAGAGDAEKDAGSGTGAAAATVTNADVGPGAVKSRVIDTGSVAGADGALGPGVNESRSMDAGSFTDEGADQGTNRSSATVADFVAGIFPGSDSSSNIKKNRKIDTATGSVTLRSTASPQEAVLAVGEIYALAVDGLLSLRQSRSKLDMEDVVAYIDAHFQDAISLETVSGQFLISREHLSRAFKARTGENLSDYIMRKRMEKARSLIAVDRLPIKHAAQLSGYEDIAYFYRVFKKHFGITPGELRKEGE